MIPVPSSFGGSDISFLFMPEQLISPGMNSLVITSSNRLKRLKLLEMLEIVII